MLRKWGKPQILLALHFLLPPGAPRTLILPPPAASIPETETQLPVDGRGGQTLWGEIRSGFKSQLSPLLLTACGLE